MAKTQYLDYAGLTKYDELVKSWVKGSEGKITVSNTHFTVPSGQTSATVKDALDQLVNEQSAAAIEVQTITGTSTDTFAKQYKLWTGDIDNTKTGDAKYTSATLLGTIDIPKDFLVKSGSVKVVATADDPVTGYAVGDKYIDFVVNSKDTVDSAKEEHIYILVKDLVDVYTAQASATQVQLAISATNEISASIVAKSITSAELADAVQDMFPEAIPETGTNSIAALFA